MKYLLLLLLVTPNFVYAENVNKIPMQNYAKACPLVYELAKLVMESRQMGMPITEAIKPIVEVDDEDIQQLNKELVVNAYKIDVARGTEEKQRVIEVFSNEAALSCLESK